LTAFAERMRSSAINCASRAGDPNVAAFSRVGTLHMTESEAVVGDALAGWTGPAAPFTESGCSIGIAHWLV